MPVKYVDFYIWYKSEEILPEESRLEDFRGAL